MKKINSFIFCFTFTIVCFAQVSDDFTDGDFTSNPAWSGSTSQFMINASKQLQLSNTVAGQSYLSTPFSTNTLDGFEWQVYVKQNFASSSTNYGRVYLVSDQSDLTQPLNGYYLQFGEALSNDAIELFRQNGSTSASVCRGTNAAIANAFAVRVKVTRDNTGLWKLFVDYTGGTNFSQEASGTDATISNSAFLGVKCVYTVTNANKFFYDDFFVETTGQQTDQTPPTLTNVQTTSPNSVSLLFSEPLDKFSAETITNYLADNSIGNPATATLQSDGKTVVISFSKNFTNGVQNQLSVVGVKDLAGNAMASTNVSFLFFQAVRAKSKDVIITEIFPDPSPQVGLPAQEFLEIYNRSAYPFDLSGWKLSDGVSTATFGTQIILPNQYWIVCASSNASLFTGNVVGVTNFPTLNNSGDNLTLRDTYNKTVDSLTYTLDWYHDADKQEGGWTLEIIDVNNSCGEGENWTASEDPLGGTPGNQNSVFASKPDLTGPQLVSVNPISSTILNLVFNEKLEKDISSIAIELTPATVIQKKYFTDQSLRQISVELSSELQLRRLYSIKVNNLTDCTGNFIQEAFNQTSFALPEKADSLDLVINEVLFNPKTGGVDFVEVYNRSPKYINLKNWKLANDPSGLITTATTITSGDFILAPSNYLVFTSDPATLSLQYSQAILKTLFKSNVPSMPDDAGSIAIVNDQNLVIDHFSYSEKMHSPFIKDNEGVSLERISFSESTNEASNWKSANASTGFATPGFTNSNSRSAPAFNDNAVNVEPEIFSPSVPGKDFSRINYKFDQSGMAANVKILDSQGRLIKTLANNETIGVEGFFRWDGDREDGTKTRMGYYVVWFEVVDLNGSSTVFRKRAVVGK